MIKLLPFNGRRMILLLVINIIGHITTLLVYVEQHVPRKFQTLIAHSMDIYALTVSRPFGRDYVYCSSLSAS